MKERKYLNKNLFGEEPLKPGEKGYLEPGYHFDERGNIIDDGGNIYDEDYTLKKAAPSEGLLMARKQHPDWGDEELAKLASFYQAKINNNKKRSRKLK